MTGDINDPNFYPRLRVHLEEMEKNGSSPNHLSYVSKPASVAGPIIEGLGAVGLNRRDNGWTRIILEKPFGRDLKSANRLNQVVQSVFDEKAVYRIDCSDQALYVLSYKGDCTYFSIPIGGSKSENAVWTYENPYEAVASIKEYLAFYPSRVDSPGSRACRYKGCLSTSTKCAFSAKRAQGLEELYTSGLPITNPRPNHP